MAGSDSWYLFTSATYKRETRNPTETEEINHSEMKTSYSDNVEK